MFGNTVTVRATIPLFASPAVAAGATGVATAPVPGLAPGDTIIPFPATQGGVIVLITGGCAFAGTLDLTFFNPTAAPSPGGAFGPLPATILKNTGSV